MGVRTMGSGTRRIGWIGAVVALLVVAASCSLVQGPITSPGAISFASGFDPGQVGYERSEFFMSGLALSYAPTAPLTNDGKWSVQPSSTNPVGGFNTRMVVY